MKRPRVLLADDHTLLLDAFRKLLEPHCTVVGAVTDGRALVEAAVRLKPEVIVLDVSMPLLNGLDAAIQVRKKAPGAKLVFVTMSDDPDLAAEAFRIGASGFLLKNSAATELLEAIREAADGRAYVSSRATRGMVDSFLKAPQPGGRKALTPRQREVLQLLAEGRTMKEVAAVLKLTPRTVAFHKYRLMKSLGVRSNAQLVQYALKKGIVTS